MVHRRRVLPGTLAAAALAVAAVIAGAASGATAVAAAPPAATAPADVLPNLVQLPPSDVQVVETRRGGTTRWDLRFTSIAGNSGSGPLHVRSTRATATGRWTTVQLVSRTRGPVRAVPLAVTVAFETSDGHNHFHIARFQRYELRDAAGGVIARDTKAGYCLGDRAPLGTAAAPIRFIGTCGRGQPRLLTLVQGISAGWADPYESVLPGQSFDVTDLPAGRYVLVNRVNDLGRYRETSLADNAASVALELTRPGGPDAAPVVAVLASCLADRC